MCRISTTCRMSSIKSKGKILRCSPHQINKLVDYMSTHNSFANGEFTGPLGRRQQKEQWIELQQMLREYGPNKSVEQWRITWRDLKKKARAEAAIARFAANAKGNQLVIPNLSDNNEKILGIIGEESIYGIELTETELESSPAIPLPGLSPQLIPPTPPVPPLPPPTSPPQQLSPSQTSLPSQPSSPAPPPSPPPPSFRQRPAGWPQTKQEFLPTEAETHGVFKELSNYLNELRRATTIQTKIRMAERLRASRMDKLKYL